MSWEPPAFEEIKMDAEFTAYCDDVPLPEPGEADPQTACASES